MLPMDGCKECRLLYKSHRDATITYHKLLNQYELAALCRDSGVLEALDQQRREALGKRVRSRKAVDDHINRHGGVELL